MRASLLSSVLFCVFLACSGSDWPPVLDFPKYGIKHQLCVQLLKMDIKKVCEHIEKLPIPLAGVAKEICKYVDDIIRKQKDGVKPDEICTWMGF